MTVTAFIRIKNEETFLKGSIMSIAPFVDEIHCTFNLCTDKSEEIVDKLIEQGYNIKKFYYNQECAVAGQGYIQQVQINPKLSLADYYNFCLSQITTTHALKWDADMYAIHNLMPNLKKLSERVDVYCFDGFDILGKHSTDSEPRLFKLNGTCYRDSTLYEVIQHPHAQEYVFHPHPCYLHLKHIR